MVKKIKKVAKALKKASALHKKQSKVIEKHIKDMKSYGKKKHVLYDIKYLLGAHEVDGRL